MVGNKEKAAGGGAPHKDVGNNSNNNCNNSNNKIMKIRFIHNSNYNNNYDNNNDDDNDDNNNWSANVSMWHFCPVLLTIWDAFLGLADSTRKPSKKTDPDSVPHDW